MALSEIGRRLVEGIESYSPSEDTLRHIGGVSLVVVVGPSGVGKDTVMSGALQYASELHRVVSDTTRPQRINNGTEEHNGDEYFFLSEKDMLKGVEQGSYVQLDIGPNGETFYGSRAESYSQEGTATMDVLMSSAEKMSLLPFGSFESVVILPPSYDEWLRRWNSRGEISDEDKVKRMTEARSSIKLTLDHGHTVLINDDPNEAAKQLVAVAERHASNLPNQEKARKIGEEIMNRITQELNSRH